ncbi:MAG: hypothetical protein AAF487_14050 [Bacteroidota bacterium]
MKEKQMNDAEFFAKFESCQLDPSLFDHRAHIRLVWICIDKFGFEETLQKVQELIKSYVEHLGAFDKYNATLTVAAINVVFAFMQDSASPEFDEFLKENSDLLFNFKALISQHYSFDIFSSKMAASQYIEPDLLPFKSLS